MTGTGRHRRPRLLQAVMIVTEFCVPKRCPGGTFQAFFNKSAKGLFWKLPVERGGLPALAGVPLPGGVPLPAGSLPPAGERPRFAAAPSRFAAAPSRFAAAPSRFVAVRSRFAA